MDKVIVTGLLVIASVTAAAMVIVTIVPSISSSGQSVASSQREASNRISTSIEIIAISSNASGTQIDVWVKSVGVRAITAINKSDVFLVQEGIRFDAMANNQAGGANTWKTEPANPSWNRGDTLHIIIEPSPVVGSGDHTLIVSTPNGISAEKSFQKP
ncbi:MAG: hypothetical protein IIC24_00280 [Chloroflexi bacterium]|nr:hypothetical protein [Chloroflexota bacterium]MCH8309058.1 hypothetical protein [Chloroflexota bacterium]